MLTISPITSYNTSNIKNTNRVFSKNISYTPSFGAAEIEDENYSSPVGQFLLRIKVRKDANKLIEKADDIYRLSQIDQQSAQNIVDGKVKSIINELKAPTGKIVQKNGKNYYVESKNGKLSNVTSFSSYGGDCVVEQVSVYNDDSTRDVFITDSNNEVIFIRKGVKQIGPNSYLEERAISCSNGQIELYYDNASRVNDGVAKAKSETKHNLCKFENGLLVGFAPKATYTGNDLYYDKYYFFDNDNLKKYMQNVPVQRGVMCPEIELDF